MSAPEHGHRCAASPELPDIPEQPCDCGLAALVEKAANYDAIVFLDDATRLREASAVEELTLLRADAAKWREFHAVWGQADLDLARWRQINNDAARFRKIAAAVESGVYELSIERQKNVDGEMPYHITRRADCASDSFVGATLDEAIDQLPEAQ